MSAQTIRILIAGALLVHGIGHTLGFWKPAHSLPFLTVSEATLSLAGGIFWAISAVGFVASSMGFYGILVPAHLWRPLAAVFAVISLVALILFGRSWPIFNLLGASAMNVVILAAIVWLQWPPVDMFNR
jgi:hypothetical protein